MSEEGFRPMRHFCIQAFSKVAYLVRGQSILSCLTLSFVLSGTMALANPSVDDLPDLTEGVVPVVQYKVSDALSGTGLTSVSEVEYIVKVKNQTGDPLVADSLILVVDEVR